MKNLFMVKNITIILLLVITILFFYCAVQYKIIKNKENKFKISIKQQKDIIENFIDNRDSNKDNNKDNKQIIHYLYWTGGFDSTFRLCEMLINEGKTVQPIYVSLVLDNDCQSEETCNKLWLRRNRKEEKKAMKNIINILTQNFPYTKKTLLPLIEIDQPILDNFFNYKFEQKFYSDNLWPRKRRKHQYLFLSKYAYYHKKNIDIGVLGIHERSKFAKFLKHNLVKTEEKYPNYIIPINNHPLSYLNFPLYNRTKMQLLQIAQRNRYDNILHYTWSCWFPKNGLPCGKCPMCKERIV